jgi:N-acetylmuramoyl-L-alanine amidase
MFKYKILLFLIFCFFCTSYYVVEGKENAMPLMGKVIYIDAGHGGLDPGAMYKNIKEKDINLEISLKLENRLTELGATVYQTRYGDYDLSVKNTNNRKISDLSRRTYIINESKCDMYLSIHLNADSSSVWKGMQIFYDDVLRENKDLAVLITKDLKKHFSNVREIKELTGIYIYRRVKVPGILIEAGFLSNANDRYLLKQKEHQNKLANVIANSVVNYYK